MSQLDEIYYSEFMSKDYILENNKILNIISNGVNTLESWKNCRDAKTVHKYLHTDYIYLSTPLKLPTFPLTSIYKSDDSDLHTLSTLSDLDVLADDYDLKNLKHIAMDLTYALRLRKRLDFESRHRLTVRNFKDLFHLFRENTSLKPHLVFSMTKETSDLIMRIFRKLCNGHEKLIKKERFLLQPLQMYNYCLFSCLDLFHEDGDKLSLKKLLTRYTLFVLSKASKTLRVLKLLLQFINYTSILQGEPSLIYTLETIYDKINTKIHLANGPNFNRSLPFSLPHSEHHDMCYNMIVDADVELKYKLHYFDFLLPAYRIKVTRLFGVTDPEHQAKKLKGYIFNYLVTFHRSFPKAIEDPSLVTKQNVLSIIPEPEGYSDIPDRYRMVTVLKSVYHSAHSFFSQESEA